MLNHEEDPNDLDNGQRENTESNSTGSFSLRELLEDLRLEQLETA